MGTKSPLTIGSLRIDRAAGGVVITDGTGTVVLVIVEPSQLAVRLTAGGSEEWEGILGNANGDPLDDFRTRDGTDLGPEPDYDVLHGAFADSWRITDDESLLEYGPGETTATFTDAPYPIGGSSTSFRDYLTQQLGRAEQAAATCRAAGVLDPTALAQCTMDFQVTGDVAFVQVSQRVDGLERAAAGSGDGRATGTGDVGPGPEATWVASFADLDVVEHPQLVDDGAGHVLVSASDGDGGVLLAVDVQSGTEVWRRAGIDSSCAPLALGDGRIAAIGAAGDPVTGDPDDPASSTLVLLDAATGELAGGPVSSAADGERLQPCTDGLTLADSVLLVEGTRALHAFDVGTSPTWVWTRPHVARPTGGNPVPLADAKTVAFAEAQSDGTLAVVVLDAVTGALRAEAAIPGTGFATPPTLLRSGNHLVLTTLERSGGHTLGLLAPGNSLSIAWDRPTDESGGDPLGRVLRQAVVADGTVVGRSGAPVLALDVMTGTTVWTHAASDRNSGSPIAAAADGTVYDGAGSAWAYSLASDGALRWSLTAGDLFADPTVIDSALAFGPVIDGALHVATSADGHPVVVSIAAGDARLMAG